jgi:ribosome biogenesis GTPase
MMKTSTGRIVRSLSGFYEVQTEEGTVTCRARGSLRRTNESPMTGDMVQISIERGKGMVDICHYLIHIKVQ